MAFVDIKNPAERNKLIAAILLGVVALAALYFAFGRSLFGSSTKAATTSTPTPKPSVSPGKDNFKLPTAEEQNFQDVTTLIVYNPRTAGAPDPGRNIFAFYEPPPPTPYSPTPVRTPPPTPPPTPGPTPHFVVSYIGPENVYAGSRGFRLEVNGDRFTPDARIYFSQTEMPTTYVNGQKLVTDIPSNLIAGEGPRQVIVQTPDGKKYSNQVMLSVQAPPKPQFEYIGMIGRKRYNNDTAYFLEKGKQTPFGARLNDVVGGSFRLVSIQPAEVTFVDVNLGFRHKIAVTKQSGSGSSGPAGPAGPMINNGFGPGGGLPPPQNTSPDCVPGIPCNIPRSGVPTPQPGRTPVRKDVDDNDDGNGR
jgi:hypothetical protein